MKLQKRLLALALASASTTAFAVPFSPVDGRSFSMGGTGVANAKAASAGQFNPALLAAQKSTADFSIILPTVGVIADDSDGFVDALNDMQDGSLKQMENAIDAWNSAPIPANAVAVGNAAQAMAQELPSLNGKPVTLNVGAGFGFGIPSQSLGFGLHASTTADLGVVSHINAADIATLNQIYLDSQNPGGFVCPPNPGYMDASCNLLDADQIITSDMQVVGVAIAEVGLSFAHDFGFAAIGITPKMMKIETFHYADSLGKSDELEDIAKDKNYRTEYTNFNVDLGVAKTIGEPDSALVLGLVIKNLLGKNYKTIATTSTAGVFYNSYEIELKPQARAGIAKRWNHFSLASDLDLTKNKGVGLSKESQFLAVGAEMDLRFLQLRAGYRHNLVSGGVQDMLTAGIGIGPVDISAMYADENSAGVNVQLGFSF